MRKISVETNKMVTAPLVEIVERKGIGDPDTICDSIAEEVSKALSKHYLEEYGTILHHNSDKGLLIAGSADIQFGGGKLTQPMKYYIGGRATSEFQGKQLPIHEIARSRLIV